MSWDHRKKPTAEQVEAEAAILRRLGLRTTAPKRDARVIEYGTIVAPTAEDGARVAAEMAAQKRKRQS